MTAKPHATFFLPEPLLGAARAGDHNFLGQIETVLREAGFEVGFQPPEAARGSDPGYSLFHMREPLNPRGLTLRRAYYYPFWQIQRSNERWQWDVAQADFAGAEIDRAESQRFYGFWRKRLFAPHIDTVTRDGFVYVPLQGRLLERRSFQQCSPIAMLHHVLRQEPSRRVIASLHPKEHYDDEEIATLEGLEGRVDRLEIRVGEMEPLLAGCDYVVTQNSSAAFAGFFFAKPCVLFGRIDFHHIAANVADLGVEAAFERVREMAPEYAAYVWWFLQCRAINAGRPEAPERIRARLAGFGWPL